MEPNDPLTAKVENRLAEIFETDLTVHIVATGTAANALSLAAICPPYGKTGASSAMSNSLRNHASSRFKR